MPSVFTKEEVYQHRTQGNIWVAIKDKVYDVTGFIEDHPGGMEILLEQAGLDATVPFQDVGHSEDAKNLLKEYYIGDLVEKKDKNDACNSYCGKKCNYMAIVTTVGCSVALLAVAYQYFKGHHP